MGRGVLVHFCSALGEGQWGACLLQRLPRAPLLCPVPSPGVRGALQPPTVAPAGPGGGLSTGFPRIPGHVGLSPPRLSLSCKTMLVLLKRHRNGQAPSSVVRGLRERAAGMRPFWAAF